MLALAAPAGDGCSLREHLEAAERQSGTPPAQLIAPDCSAAGAEVWGWFLELDRVRGSNGFGPNPIGYAEIRAWMELTGRRPSVLEVGWLVELDRVALRQHAEHAAKRGRT